MLLLLLMAPAGALRLDAPPQAVASAMFDGQQPAYSAASEAAACVPMANRGSHYTVRVEVGTPPRTMDLLADTGSDAVIVNACQCGEADGCSGLDKCFSPHRSTTFNQSHESYGHESRVVMMFGSGEIESKVGSDVVNVGGLSAQLHQGLYMLVRRKLNINGPFEGILGLGPPHEKLTNETDRPRALDPYGFLEAAGVSRFSICLNRGTAGFLRLGTPPVEPALSSVAKAHWGLRLQGLSVGDWRISGLCASTEGSGEPRLCGAMPDSGTTLIAAPSSQLKVLFSHLCDHWPRCSNGFKENAYQTSNKWFHFERLLLDCHDWAGLKGTELNATLLNQELPHIRFVLAGRDGERQQLKLTGEEYLTHMYSSTHLAKPAWLGGRLLPVPGALRKICAPAFHAMETDSVNLGQIWILGLPIMHKYKVSYDRSTHPPSMSFSSGMCESCGEVRLSRGAEEAQLEEERRPGLLWLDEPPQVSPFAMQWF